MTYNVRKFNIFDWLDIKNIESEIKELIINEDPDILTLQEFRNLEKFKLDYPYFYNHITNKNVQSGLAIYSKYPVINKGFIFFILNIWKNYTLKKQGVFIINKEIQFMAGIF